MAYSIWIGTALYDLRSQGMVNLAGIFFGTCVSVVLRVTLNKLDRGT